MFHRPRRRPSTMMAAIRVGARDRAVGVIDVSEAGLCLSTKDAFVEGQAITVVTPRMQLAGTVRWAAKGQVGVILDRKLTPSQQTELSGLSWGL